MASVRKWVADRARSVAPRTMSNLEALSRANAEFDGSGPRMIVYERELRDLRREVDSLRREHRRVIELYDAVFDYVRANGAGQGVGPGVGHGPGQLGANGSARPEARADHHPSD